MIRVKKVIRANKMSDGNIKRYVYIGGHTIYNTTKGFRKETKICNEELLRYKKIGTTQTLEKRAKELSVTNEFLGFKYLGVWDVTDNQGDIEKALHSILDNKVENSEWFLDEEEMLYARVSIFMKKMKCKEFEIIHKNKNIFNNRSLVIDLW